MKSIKRNLVNSSNLGSSLKAENHKVRMLHKKSFFNFPVHFEEVKCCCMANIVVGRPNESAFQARGHSYRPNRFVVLARAAIWTASKSEFVSEARNYLHNSITFPCFSFSSYKTFFTLHCTTQYPSRKQGVKKEGEC